VVLESTTYPGTTRERLAPILEESGMAAGRDFHLASQSPAGRMLMCSHIARSAPGRGVAG